MGVHGQDMILSFGMIRAILALAVLAAPAAALANPADPLDSPMWDYHAKRILGGQPYVFDQAVQVSLPDVTENQHVFPVTVDARALSGVQKIVLFADLNPIPVAVAYSPMEAEAYIGTRIKLDQRTPVRAAVLTADGVWHVSGGWVDAAGGGCSAPPVSRVKGDWADHLGEMRGAAWDEAGDVRLRVGFRHPMDTGLVENIPAYNIETLAVTDAGGATLAEMEIWGSVSEDPSFTLMVRPQTAGNLNVAARDTNGLEFDGVVQSGEGRKLAAAFR